MAAPAPIDPNAPVAQQQNPWAGDAHWWRIVWHWADDPVETEVIRRFSNAWGAAQPPAADDEPGWTYTHRANLWEALQTDQPVRVAWRDDDGTYITLQRL
jgi:hypothetical protein